MHVDRLDRFREAILHVLRGISLAAHPVVISRATLALLMMFSLSVSAGQGMCSRILNSTNPFVIVKRSIDPFLTEASKTTPEERDAMIERIKNFYMSETTKRNHHVLQELTAGRGQIVSLRGSGQIIDFLNAVKDPSPELPRRRRAYPLVLLGSVIAVKMLETMFPEYESLIRNVGLVGVVGYGLWVANQSRQNEANVQETNALSLIRRQLYATTNRRNKEYIHISRSFTFDHIDVYYTPDDIEPVLDIVYWKGLTPLHI